MSEIDTSTAAIAALMDGVTPGPWCAGAHRWPTQVGCCPLVGQPFSAHHHLRNVAAANTEADIRFIAASRELVPALSAERDALRAEVERLRAIMSRAHAVMRECGWQLAIAAEPQSDGVLEAACTEVEAEFAEVLKGGANA